MDPFSHILGCNIMLCESFHFHLVVYQADTTCSNFLRDPTYLLLLGCGFVKDEVHSNHLGKNCAVA